MTKEFKPVPSPHPNEKDIASPKAAPLVGAIIISWTEVERAMGRSIRNERMRLKTDLGMPDRKLSHKFAVNMNEWIRLFVSSERSAKKIRDEARRLQRIRNDMAHNIWDLRFDTSLGVVINVVRENDDFYKEEMEWLADVEAKGKRSQKLPPESFYTNTYYEGEITRAVEEIGLLWTTMLKLELGHYEKVLPKPKDW